METVEETLARFAAERDVESLPDQVIVRVKELMLDSFGCALAGSTAPGVEAALYAVDRWGGAPQSTVYAHGLRVPSYLAALANGTMSTARDFDDAHDKAVLRTQPAVLPAALAAGEAEGGRAGRDLIAAVAAGTEFVCRVGLARRRGLEFLATGTVGCMAAAAAAARMMGLSAEATLNACGIAYSQAAANVQPLREGATVKRFHTGFAAQNGVLSATMARAGLTGAHRFLLGQYGYLNLYERGDYVPDPLISGLGENWELLGVSLKPYPSARENHGALEAATSLVAEYGLRPEEMDRIVVWLPPNAFRLAGKPFAQATGHPVVEAIASAAYGVAVAILRGRVGLADYQESAIMDPRVRELATRVDVQVDPQISDPVVLVPQTVEFGLRDGRVLRRSSQLLKGHPSYPMSREEVLAKFHDCCRFAARPVSPDRANAIVDAVDHLEEMPDVRELGDLLAL